MDFDDVYDIKVNGIDADNLIVNGRTVWERRIPASISLEVDEPVIMAGETATLTATVLDGDGLPCQGVPVSFSSDITNTGSLGNTITNNSGIATFEYNGTGLGDTVISASIGELEDSLTVEDCIWWDNGIENKLSHYTQHFYTSTINTTTEGYEWVSTPNNKNILDFNIPKQSEPFTFEIDYKFTSSTGQENGLTIFNGFNDEDQSIIQSIDLLQYPTTYGLAKYTNKSWIEIKRTTDYFFADTWYRFKLTVTEGQVKGELTNLSRGNTFFNHTASYDCLNDVDWRYGFKVQFGTSTCYIKNIKLKKLTT